MNTQAILRKAKRKLNFRDAAYPHHVATVVTHTIFQELKQNEHIVGFGQDKTKDAEEICSLEMLGPKDMHVGFAVEAIEQNYLTIKPFQRTSSGETIDRGTLVDYRISKTDIAKGKENLKSVYNTCWSALEAVGIEKPSP